MSKHTEEKHTEEKVKEKKGNVPESPWYTLSVYPTHNTTNNTNQKNPKVREMNILMGTSNACVLSNVWSYGYNILMTKGI